MKKEGRQSQLILVMRSPVALPDGSLAGGSVELLGHYVRVLKSLQVNGPVILSSPARRCLATSELLRKALGATVRRHKELLAGEHKSPDVSAFMRCVAEYEGFPCLILVTHFPYDQLFPERFAQERWEMRIDSGRLPKGESVLIRPPERTITPFIPTMWELPGTVAEPRGLMPIRPGVRFKSRNHRRHVHI